VSDLAEGVDTVQEEPGGGGLAPELPSLRAEKARKGGPHAFRSEAAPERGRDTGFSLGATPLLQATIRLKEGRMG